MIVIERCRGAMEPVVATVAGSFSEWTPSDRAPVRQRRRRLALRRCVSRAVIQTLTVMEMATAVDDGGGVTWLTRHTCSSAAPTAVDGPVSGLRTSSTVSCWIMANLTLQIPVKYHLVTVFSMCWNSRAVNLYPGIFAFSLAANYLHDLSTSHT